MTGWGWAVTSRAPAAGAGSAVFTSALQLPQTGSSGTSAAAATGARTRKEKAATDVRRRVCMAGLLKIPLE
jgi:hypothetical protein